MNEAYSINIDNNLNKKWECLHHCWARWIAISMKRAMLDKKQSVLEVEAMDDGWWIHIGLWWHQYASGRLLQGIRHMCLWIKWLGLKSLMCRTYSCFVRELWLTQRVKERRRMKMQTCSLRRFSSYLVRSLLALFSRSLIFFCCAGPRPKNT